MGEITNGQELAILSRYAGGEDLKSISKALGLPCVGGPNDAVVEAVRDLANFDRGRAQTLVKQAAAKMASRKAAAAPQPVVVLHPAPTHIKLLDKAEQSGNARLVRQAERIRQSLSALAEMVAGWEQRAEAEQRVAELRRQLAEAEAQLRRASGSGGPTKAAQRGQRAATAREIRAWAKQNGVECNALGIIPARVVEAYRAAHPEVSGG